MADYISLVDIENKTIYDLGKASEAKYYLPYLAFIYQDKPILIYGDETHGWCEDKYEYEEEENYSKKGINSFNMNRDTLDNIIMSRAEFYEIFNQIGGKEITNLNYYIRFKYTE